MQNQDPLNPMDNSEVTTQLAQLATAQGVNNLNTSITALSSAFTASQTLQASSLIGHDVLAAGTSMSLSGGAATAGIQLAQNADSVQVNVLDAAGNVIRVLNLGTLNAGVNSFNWDGNDASGNAMPDGSYRFQVKATAQGQAITATTLSLGKVSAVSVSPQGLSVDAGALGSLPLSAIQQIM
jgi:flagellar basal-body rod modification protein FlgD